MGLLDGLAGQVLGNVLGGGGGQQGNPLLEVIMSLIQNQQGGLGGLLEQFGKAGLGDQTASWVGTGENMPVSADQISSALGEGAIGDIAARLGMSSGDASGALADLLPQVVDKLTPNGQVSDSSSLLQQGLGGLLGGLFRG
ncbi:MAG: DUF937 domain-containing protein [Betaproteobacteria bacterium]|nr:DUF937 domain-containing protein [Betaproteobacteria bacterium]